MSAALALFPSGASAFHGTVSAPTKSRSIVMETKADLKQLAKEVRAALELPSAPPCPTRFRCPRLGS